MQLKGAPNTAIKKPQEVRCAVNMIPTVLYNCIHISSDPDPGTIHVMSVFIYCNLMYEASTKAVI